MKDKRIKHLGIVGHFGEKNLGDEIMLKCFLDMLKLDNSSALRLTVLTHDPEFTRKDIGSNYPHLYFVLLTIRHLVQIVMQVDTLVLCGGTHFHDYQKIGLRHFSQIIKLIRWWIVFALARLLGKQVIFLAIGIGPIESGIYRFITKQVIHLSNYMTLRDQDSYSLCQEMEIKTPYYYTTDLALNVSNMKWEFPRNKDLFLGITLLPFFQVYQGRGEQDTAPLKEIATALNSFAKNCGYKGIKILTFYDDIDYNIAQQLRQILEIENSITRYDGNLAEVLAEMSQCNIFLGCRLHSSILTYALKRKLLVIDYHPKCRAFAREISLPDEFIIRLAELDAEQLLLKLNALHDVSEVNYNDLDEAFAKRNDENLAWLVV